MSIAIELDPLEFNNPNTISAALDLLRVDGTFLYRAGFPGYNNTNFSRDGLEYAMIAGDKEALLAQVDFSAQHQGTTYDPVTGEEPGKIHHELDGEWRDRSTKYNACDTTALFLLAIARLQETGEVDVLDRYAENIDRALSYIKIHTVDGLFTESPEYCGAKNFALRVTYWKDSVLNGPYEEPKYPIVYSLVHFQNAAAIQAIGHLRGDGVLVETADEMTAKGVDNLWAGDHFIVARDGDGGIIDAPSSDSLHSLLYIDPDLLPLGYAELIEQYMYQLETEAGYRTGIPVGNTKDRYHTDYIWNHEQAPLYEAARRFKLHRAMSVAKRVILHEIGFYELSNAQDLTPAGNQIQLWVVGLHQYFDKPDHSLLSSRSLRDALGEAA